MRSQFIAAIGLSFLLTSKAELRADVPLLLSYQGRAVGMDGINLNGNFNISFAILDQPVGGSAYWSESHNGVVVTDGLFSVLLGSVIPLSPSHFLGSDLYLGIQIGSDPELMPRRRIVSNAFAIRSLNADSVGWSGVKNIPPNFGIGDITAVIAGSGLSGGGTFGSVNLDIPISGINHFHILDGTITNGDVNNAAGIAATKINGTAATLASSQTFLGVNTFDQQVRIGDSTFRADNNGISIGKTFAPSPNYLIALWRHFNSNIPRFGLYSNVANAGTGAVQAIYGRAQATSTGAGAAQAMGVYGEAYSENALRIGVRGYADPSNPALTTGDSYGVLGQSWYGNIAVGAGGVSAAANTGYGLFGVARLSDVQGYGAHCTADSNYNSAYGVYAEARDNYGSSYALYGYSISNESLGYGVYALSSLNGGTSYGIRGAAVGNTGTGYGVYGTASANSIADWAGYFVGDVNVTGTIFTPAKMTRIDHPIDPENKFLVHNTVESSEMTNMYSGNVVLDANGNATVSLPDWFQSANTDFRYQLTCVGGYAPVYISEKLSNNRFRISGGASNLEVSWQVTALRNDEYSRANEMSAEVLKRPHERGKYAYPEAFGLSEKMAIDYEDRQTTLPEEEN